MSTLAPWLRWPLLALGGLCLGLALLGAVLPLLPSTVFVIAAAACFCRASPRAQAWLWAHPQLGPPLRAWQQYGALSRRSKAAACAGMAMGLGVLGTSAMAPRVSVWGSALVLAAVALYLLTRPTLSRGQVRPALRGWRPRAARWPGVLGVTIPCALLAVLCWHKPEQHRPQAPHPAPIMVRLPLDAALPAPPLEPAPLPQAQPQRPEAPPLLLAPLLPDVLEPAAAAPAPSAKAHSRSTASTPNTHAEAPAPALPATAVAASPALPPAATLSRSGQDSWEGRVLAHLERYRQYPAAERAQRIQGVSYVRLRLNRQGQLLQLALLRSSGHGGLDRAALATLRRAAPLPAIPAGLPEELELQLPVEFFLQG
ncbi:TonB family protein [Roseateles sp. BYS180W]|uniref:TonB family protein n=1 Tax=Roseateles rivi TaxID=3299028 RepID=A0ABW7FTM1_9BURK